jgi:hypothetical protein
LHEASEVILPTALFDPGLHFQLDSALAVHFLVRHKQKTGSSIALRTGHNAKNDEMNIPILFGVIFIKY